MSVRPTQIFRELSNARRKAEQEKKAIINRQPTQPGDVLITFADVSKARAKLEYNPRVKIAEGIPRFVEWFQRKTG